MVSWYPCLVFTLFINGWTLLVLAQDGNQNDETITFPVDPPPLRLPFREVASDKSNPSRSKPSVATTPPGSLDPGQASSLSDQAAAMSQPLTSSPPNTAASLSKPVPSLWIKGRQPDQKIQLISWMIDGCIYCKNSTNCDTTPDVKICSTNLTELEKNTPLSEVQSYDGFFNNIFKVDLGAVDTPLLRRVPPVYDDGTYMPATKGRANPFSISDALMERKLEDCVETETVTCGSRTGKTALLVFFGQQLVEEILDAQRPGCPPEYFNIKIPENHRFRKDSSGNFSKTEMPLLRSRYAQNTGQSPSNPRQQLNEITPWFDGGLVYGTAKGWADVLRTETDDPNPANWKINPRGQLASQDGKGYFPAQNKIRLPLANPPPPARHCRWVRNHQTAPVDRFFVLGNPRGNENAFLLTFGVALFRWHNQIASYLDKTRPHWSSERKFNEARKWVIATHQQIVYYDWLKEWLGDGLEPYKGYDPSVDPQIEQFFQTAAMRFGHTLVTPGVYLRDYACAGCNQVQFPGLKFKKNKPTQKSDKLDSEKAVRTCNIFWRPDEPLVMKTEKSSCVPQEGTEPFADIDRMLMGMASQRAEREDNMIVEDLRGQVFGTLEFSRRDLMAVNIQRGRDHGTPDYNTARESFGLPRICSVDDFINKNGLKDSPHDVRSVIQRLADLHRNESIKNNDLQTFENPKTCWNNIDVWAGGILETNKNRPGPLFLAIIKDQFRRIRSADRFWFENTKWRDPRFSDDQITRIKQLTIFDLLVSVTNMLEEDIQPNPFRLPDNDFMNTKSAACKNGIRSATWVQSSCYTPVFNNAGNETREVKRPCYHLPQLHTKGFPVENCTLPGTYDYFSGSEAPFILTFLAVGATILGVNCLVPFLTWWRKSSGEKRLSLRKKQQVKIPGVKGTLYSARHWAGSRQSYRSVYIAIPQTNIVQLHDMKGGLIRKLDFTGQARINIITVTDGLHLLLKNSKEYDCVLKFEAQIIRDSFLENLTEKFDKGIDIEITVSKLNEALANAVTKKQREEQLAKFFKVLFPYVSTSDAPSGEKDLLDPKLLREVITMELTRAEFAEALNMSVDSGFVRKIFDVADKDGNGYISFREFMEILVMLKKDSSVDAKLRLLFDMYDVERDGLLSQTEFKDMIKSLAESGNNDVQSQDVEALIQTMLETANVHRGSQLNFDSFKEFFMKYKDVLGYAQLNFIGTNVPQELQTKAAKAPANRGTLIRSIYGDNPQFDPEPSEKSPLTFETATKDKRSVVSKWIEINRLQFFWCLMYILVLAGIFGERAYYYSVEREHGGLRHIAGYGVTVTRGAASAMIFCYSTLLLTMCRNIITILRDTFLHRIIPFDSAIQCHKFIAILGLIFVIVHVVGHGVNFYHISTQTAMDLACLFREFFRPTHVLPKFQYWCFQTVTGITGILLVLHLTVIYTFATNYTRRHAFKLFWIAHESYPLFYILMLIHGSGRLVQEPITHTYLIAPLVLFILDKLITISRNRVELPVIQADLLPSDVLRLEFARPAGFDYKSGQWVRISCAALNSSEFHPFTLSSAPHEANLTLHIRAVGPFTNKLREIYEIERPKLFLEGPYGESHQDWWRYDVSVLIGGGIGVTPCASILKDLAHSGSSRICKKLYFLWITRTQKQFEWLVDILREVEHHPIISMHIFITQIPNKYDLRTCLLYACERDFQKSSNRSLFTGLKSVTHFGRPNFGAFFASLTEIHPKVSRFGIFSCGPAPMTKTVDEACLHANNQAHLSNALFTHHSEVI